MIQEVIDLVKDAKGRRGEVLAEKREQLLASETYVSDLREKQIALE